MRPQALCGPSPFTAPAASSTPSDTTPPGGGQFCRQQLKLIGDGVVDLGGVQVLAAIEAAGYCYAPVVESCAGSPTARQSQAGRIGEGPVAAVDLHRC